MANYFTDMVRSHPLVELVCSEKDYDDYFLNVKSTFNNETW